MSEESRPATRISSTYTRTIREGERKRQGSSGEEEKPEERRKDETVCNQSNADFPKPYNAL